MRMTTRALVTCTVFGTLWGLSEMSLGSVLKSLNIPLSGAVLAAIGLIIALVGRVFVPRRGSTLYIGVVAMLLKLFSLGGVVLGPMVAILAEALVAEAILSAFPAPGRLASVSAGAGGVLWVLIHPLITNPLLFGRTAFVAWLDLLDRGSRLLGLPANAALLVVGALAILHLAIGAIAGWLAWDIGKQLQERMGRTSLQTESPLPTQKGTSI
jgi:hypothetical protein